MRGRKSRRLCVKPQTAGFPAFGFRPSIHLRFPCTRVLHSWISLYSDRQGFHDTTADGICIRGSRADLGVDLDPCCSRFFHSETLEPNYYLIYMKVMMKILMTSCAFLFLLLIITPGQTSSLLSFCFHALFILGMNNLLLIPTPEPKALMTALLARMTMLMMTKHLKIVISGILEIDSEPGVDG